MGLSLQYFWDGTRLTYKEGYSISMIKLFALIGGLVLTIALMIMIIVKMVRKRRQKYQVIIPLEDYKALSKTEDEKKLLQIQIKSLSRYILEVITYILFWVGILFTSSIFSLFSGFEYIPTGAAAFILSGLYTFALIFQIYLISSNEIGIELKQKKVKCKLLVQRKFLIMLASGVLFFLAIFCPYLMQKTCVCYHTNGYGFEFSEYQLSTQMTRYIWLPNQVCESNSICHIYATLPSDSSSAVFINIHTGTDINELIAVFDAKTESEILYQCDKIPFPSSIETRGQRNVFTCLITKLNGNQLYDVDILNDNISILKTSYKTLPSKSQSINQTFTIVYGGDFGYSTNGLNLLNQFASHEPDVILIGGDVAYDNGILNCYYSWDLMISAFEDSIRPLNRLVPLILAVGNHDVGISSMAGINITVSEQEGPLFFTYFPQEYKNHENQSGIINVADRKTFVHHFLGNFMLLTLDTGYLYDFGDPQTSWIEQTLQNYSNYNQTDGYIPIVQNHNPMFPSCHSESLVDSAMAINQAKEFWLPLFNKYKVIAAFENHVHQFKRTFPIKDGLPNHESQEGTVFFGDGCLGVGGSVCTPGNINNDTLTKGYFAAFDNSPITDHFWVMTQRSGIFFNKLRYEY